MSHIERRGVFILFEGLDRCGKTTQCDKLIEYLTKKGIPVKYLGFPDRGSMLTGKILDMYLQRQTNINPHVSHLLFSANRWEKVEEIKALLYNGYTLVVDRYAYSGIAYSVAKKMIPVSWASYSDIGLPAPDAILYFSLDFDEMKEREGFGDEIHDIKEIQSNVHQAYMHLKDRDKRQNRWRIIKANQSIDEIHQEVVSIAEQVIEESSYSPLTFLESLD